MARKSKYDYRVLIDERTGHLYLVKWDYALNGKDKWFFRGSEAWWWTTGKYKTPEGFTELERTNEYYYNNH